MRRISTVLRALICLFAGLGVAACGPGVSNGDATQSAENRAVFLTVSDAWVRLNPLPGRPAAAYFTVTNNTDQRDHLLGLDVPSGGRAHLHRSQRNGEIMQMLFITSVTVPPGGSLEFSPGGFHAMLSDLSGPPEVGSLLPLALHFERAGTVLVDAEVRAFGASN